MKIALLGDIAFFGKFSLENNEDLYNYFKNVSRRLKGYDLVIGNLETPFADASAKPIGFKSAYIKSNPVNLKLLTFLNIDVVNLANNHIYDYGHGSYELTKDLLKKNNIKYFGVENQQLVIDSLGSKIALNGFCCYSTNPLGINSKNRKGINELDIPTVSQILIENSSKNLFNIFSVHCGQEHVNYPNYDHIVMARQLSEIAPYVFYGHHPHVAQGLEKVNESLLAYSLGNFCFDDVYTDKSKEPLIKQSENNKESFILEIEIDKNTLVDYRIIPLYMGNEELEIGDISISEKIEGYSQLLKMNPYEYQEKRKALIDSYISSRKKKRNFNWYWKRLNYKSALMIKSSIGNSKKYKRSIVTHLK